MANVSPAPRADDPPAVDVAANLAAVRTRVQAAARAAGRDAREIALIAVSKGHDARRIEPALAAGHPVFGENRVQEAREKWQALKARWPDAALHLIGALQTNKVRDAVAIADAIHAIDRPKLAAALAREMERQGRRPECFIQVNTGAEPQKAGVLPDGLEALVAAVPGRPDAARARAHVPPAGRRGPGAALRAAAHARRAPRPRPPQHGHVGGLPHGDRRRRHPYQGRHRHLRRQAFGLALFRSRQPASGRRLRGRAA